MPQTTVVVDITVARESVVTGPYARFAQKYFGVIAPLADKETYTLRSAAVSRYDPVVTRDLNPGPIPAPHTEIYADTGSAEEFPRVLPDRRSASGSVRFLTNPFISSPVMCSASAALPPLPAISSRPPLSKQSRRIS